MLIQHFERFFIILKYRTVVPNRLKHLNHSLFVINYSHMLTALLQQVQQSVQQLFEQADTTHLYYHNYQHTKEVVDRIATLTQEHQIGPTNSQLLLIAGWFHDIGYLYGYDHHEDRGMEIARKYLQEQGLEQQSIQIIVNCIEATKLSLSPRNLLEQIIKDADISYGVTERFFETGLLLRQEWAYYHNKQYTNQAWEQLQYDFLLTVEFFTAYAKETYYPIVLQNIEQQGKRLLV